MKGKILWKIIVSVLILLWAVSTITPVKDTPFETFVTEQVKADNDGFKALMDKAEERAKSGKAPSVFIALGQVANEERVDISKFFPQYELEEVANLERRNGIMLRVLLRKSQGKIRLGLDLAGGVSVTFRANDTQLASNETERTSQMDKAREIIDKRVNSLGVAEPIIRLKGTDAIEVQMPGVSTKDNPDIISTIGKPALLEFSTVHRTISPRETPVAPVGYRRMVEEREDSQTGEILEIPYYIKIIPEMTGKSIESANAVIGPYGGHMVSMTFTKEGSKRFADITTRMAQDNAKTGTVGQLAIVLDGKLQSTPTVREPITGGGAQITGSFSQREAIDLANVLSNPLEVGLQVGEQNEVGASLAADAKDASYMAALIGSLLVVAFMIFYYWGSGVVAVIAVAFNILITVAGMCYFGATFTLPGVAALVLTVGMAVDSNILILERVREELRLGKSHKSALDIGYGKALATILDANLTTMLTSVILAWLGTGPVKGFGVTLSIGILGTLFCALIVSQWIMELLVSRNLLKNLVGFEFFRETKFHFMNYRWPAFIGSWAIVAVGLACVGIYWNSIFGVDFTGGDEVTMSFSHDMTVAEVTKVAEMSVSEMQELAAKADPKNKPLAESYAYALSKGGFGEVNAAFASVIGTNQETLKLQTAPGIGLAYADALTQTKPDSNLIVTGFIQIGPSVGKEVARSATISLILAMLGIGLYVALRYEWGYGLGAVVSVLHDGLMTIGMFVFLGEVCGIGSGQFTASMIAAILMVLGYSINDTIVVYDRIREELNLNPTMHLRDVIHLAINRTLSRTMLTSLTTFLATLALFIFAAGVVVDYALIFMIGIITGTFSSIFIAGTIFFWYHRGDRKIAEKSDDAPVVYDWEDAETAQDEQQ
jgi:SecD/SecF fusion protein